MDNRTTDHLKLSWAKGYVSSDLGKKYTHNEDRFLLRAWPDHSAILAAVADGMGGSQAGEIAAEIAIQTLAELIEKPLPQRDRDCYDLLLNQIYKADQTIREQASQSFQTLGMGTTLAVAILTRQKYIHLYAGDCRLYQFRNGTSIHITADHSIVRLLQEIGRITPEEVPNHPMRSKISSCLGGKGATGKFSIDPKWDDNNPPIYPLQSGDVFLLCSDGLHGLVSNETLSSLISNLSKHTEKLTNTLVNRALERGGDDNITALTVRID
jgi:protein phosphatase